MRELSLNNLGLSGHDSAIPKAQRVAQERQKRRQAKSENKIKSANVQRGVDGVLRLSHEENLLSVFTPGMRFITRNDGCGGGEIFGVYEVIKQEGNRLIIRGICSSAGYGAWMELGDTEADIGWLTKNIIALPGEVSPGFLQLSLMNKLEDISQGVAHESGLGAIGNFKVNPKYNAPSVMNLISMFIQKDYSLNIQVISPEMVRIPKFSYEAIWIYGNDNRPIEALGIGWGELFWYSPMLQDILERIYKQFGRKRVKICYARVDPIREGYSTIFVESPEEAIVGVIGDIGKLDQSGNPSEHGRFRLTLSGATQGEKTVSCIPDEAFFTGFTVEFMPEELR